MTATAETNTRLIQRLYGELMARGNTAVAMEILATDYVDHDIPGLGQGGRQELIATVQAVRASLPDVAPVLGPIVAEGDLVATRVVARGTHSGAPFPPGIPASGKSVEWKEIHVYRCANGRIAEHWGVFDMLGMLQQLGAIPA